MNSWITLFLAGLFEVSWVISMKFSEGFTKIIPTIITAILMLFSILLLEQSTKVIGLATAYACWTAIGALGVLFISILFFDESMSILKGFFLILVIVGIVGLKLTSP